MIDGEWMGELCEGVFFRCGSSGDLMRFYCLAVVMATERVRNGSSGRGLNSRDVVAIESDGGGRVCHEGLSQWVVSHWSCILEVMTVVQSSAGGHIQYRCCIECGND